MRDFFWGYFTRAMLVTAITGCGPAVREPPAAREVSGWQRGASADSVTDGSPAVAPTVATSAPDEAEEDESMRLAWDGPGQPRPAPYDRDYEPESVVHGGVIAGSVRWSRQPRKAPSLAVTHSDRCPSAIPNESQARAPGGQVVNAIVFIEGIQRGKVGVPRASYGDRLQVGGALEMRACQLRPHVQIVAPIGAVLDLRNSDPTSRTLELRRWPLPVANAIADHPPSDVERVTTITLAESGTGHEALLSRSGVYEVRSLEAGDPTTAWLAVAGHPYFVITDHRGRFVLDDVPAGRYRLVVWHEPFTTGIDHEGRAIRGPMLVARKSITVTRGRVTDVVLRL